MNTFYFSLLVIPVIYKLRDTSSYKCPLLSACFSAVTSKVLQIFIYYQMKFSKNKLVLINKHYEETHCVTSWNFFINFHENGFGRHRKKKKNHQTTKQMTKLKQWIENRLRYSRHGAYTAIPEQQDSDFSSRAAENTRNSNID